MAGRKDAEKASRWVEILKRQSDSGVSVRQFCRTEGVSEPSFYAWRKKLGTRGSDPALRATRRKDQSDDGQLFVPLKVLGTAQTLEIIHPLGCRIHVTGDVDSVALRRVIEALDERRDR
jgi:putative transposase